MGRRASSSIPMPDNSACSSNACYRHCRTPAPARSLCSQESTNRAYLCPAPKNSKKGDKNVGHRAPCSNPPDPATVGEIDEIVPLSGKPYFACIMTKSQVQGPFQLSIPRNFWSLLPSVCIPAVLCYRNKTWKMRFYGDRSFKRFDAAWKNFAVDNHLKIGDACVMELMDDKNLKFRVQILRGDIPREIAESGSRPDAPIIIE